MSFCSQILYLRSNEENYLSVSLAGPVLRGLEQKHTRELRCFLWTEFKRGGEKELN